MKNENYFPSNGTDGMIFMDSNCDQCWKEKRCTILTNSMIGKQPKQWIYDDNGYPTCTSKQTTRPKYNKKQIDYPSLF